jgi:hypothetical protein
LYQFQTFLHSLLLKNDFLEEIMQIFRSEIRTVNVTRYITPLREGGSLPAIAEADDDFMYVVKFRGAGQGVKALIAELLAGEIARILGLKIPEIVFANLDPAFGRTEPDEEIQDLLKASAGLNLALHYLSGAVTFDPVINKIDEELASKIVWFDSYVTNVDRTVRNTNMLMWHRELWLIDHGASFYSHHSWQTFEEKAKQTFVQVKDHVLLPYASKIDEVNRAFKNILTNEDIASVVSLIPEEWLMNDSDGSSENKRDIYKKFLQTRLSVSDIFVNEANNARQALI